VGPVALPAERVLTHAEARLFYDRFGAKQDSQAFYERPALEQLVAHLELKGARAVVEFGCGTGRFAADLLGERLHPDATYMGLDVSETMIGLAHERIAAFGPRADVRQTDGSPRINAPDGTFDRFLSTYVLDLLSHEDIDAVLREAHRVLRPGGLLGLVGLTRGARGIPKLVSAIWERIHRLRPPLVGGCRPIGIARLLATEEWSVSHRGVVTPYAIPSEVLVGARV
jgi:ubiquinone/menaquinone biosynthesis C-methylase UbiE